MLKTDDLKKEIVCKISEVLPDAKINKIKFAVGLDNSEEGIYVFTQNNKYHFVFTEKGKIRVHKEFDSEEEILKEILNVISFDLAFDYAKENSIRGEDFRRALFYKEMEIYSRFGEKYLEEKKEEIDKILQKNPYCDSKVN